TLPAGYLRGQSCCLELFHHLIELLAGDGDFEAQLGKKVHRVFGTAINLGVALVPSGTFHLRHGNAVYADARKGVAHFIELEGLYDGDDELHGLASPGAPVGAVLDLLTTHRSGGNESRAQKPAPVRTGSSLLRRLTAGGLKIKRVSCCTHRQPPISRAN